MQKVKSKLKSIMYWVSCFSIITLYCVLSNSCSSTKDLQSTYVEKTHNEIIINIDTINTYNIEIVKRDNKAHINNVKSGLNFLIIFVSSLSGMMIIVFIIFCIFK